MRSENSGITMGIQSEVGRSVLLEFVLIERGDFLGFLISGIPTRNRATVISVAIEWNVELPWGEVDDVRSEFSSLRIGSG